VNFLGRAKGKEARENAAAAPPFGPGFSEEIVAKTETMEVHGSEFSAPGIDYCEFRAFDVRGNLVGTKRVDGY
jgi:hypothetical protein